MRVKLTQEFVDRAKASTGREREIFWDTRTESFGLVATAGGSRAYCVQYRIDGQSRRYTFKASDWDRCLVGDAKDETKVHAAERI
ncbi:MAG: hypothetical protein EHM67_09295 [Hyphomicrobiaceae bacterium]|nr:MAG: hypothetical protein EHM67_09295 [Hyphomicrobiaceae bacterium]